MKKGVANFILSGVILAVGAVTLLPLNEETAATTSIEPYRIGKSLDGVSLTFNVYEGREIVYGILDVLDEYEGKATFYIGGCWADDNADCLKEIYARGHELGNHGYFHKDHSKLSQEENEREIAVCNDYIKLCIGIKPTLFAPPSGAYSKAQLLAAEKLGMKTVLWSKDTIDWRDRDEKIIYERATKNVKAGDIILMHPYKTTLDALSDVLLYYKNQNLRVITVSENLLSGG